MILLVETGKNTLRLGYLWYIDAQSKWVCARCPDSREMAQSADNSYVRFFVTGRGTKN